MHPQMWYSPVLPSTPAEVDGRLWTPGRPLAFPWAELQRYPAQSLTLPRLCQERACAETLYLMRLNAMGDIFGALCITYIFIFLLPLFILPPPHTTETALAKNINYLLSLQIPDISLSSFLTSHQCWTMTITPSFLKHSLPLTILSATLLISQDCRIALFYWR